MNIFANVAISLLLAIATIHLAVHWIFYVGVLISSVLRTDRRSKRLSSTILAAVVLLIMLAYNGLLYLIIYSHINVENMFSSESIHSTVLASPFVWIVTIEPIIFVTVSLFKCACAVTQLLRAQSDLSIMMRLSLNMQENPKTVPDVIVIIPVYNEPFEHLTKIMDSIASSSYPKSKTRLLIAFDDDRITPVFESMYQLIADQHNYTDIDQDSIVVGSYNGIRVDMARFQHGGKRHAQMCAFIYVQELLGDVVDRPLLLFVDSDIVLDRFAIAHLVYEMGERRFCEALTGLITIEAPPLGLLANLQTCEYIDSQVLHRGAESILGGVSCLPGALSMVRFESLRLVAREYFAQVPAVSAINFAKRSLGEDRYLTSLMLESDSRSHRIGFAVAAHCQTLGCRTFGDLLKQRRRWFLGTIANEVTMLTTLKLWRNLPRLQVLQLLLSLRNAPLFAYVALAEIGATGGSAVWTMVALVAAIHIPIWMVVGYVGAVITSAGWRPVVAYPIYALLMPILGAIFELYGVATVRRRTWGGPRIAEQPIHDDLELSDSLPL